MATALSLEQISLNYILRSLGEYSVDYLSLLPRIYRLRLLESCPTIVDVCRLEGTQFTKGIDMESIWKKMYSNYIFSHMHSDCERVWKDDLLSHLVSTILRNKRPYGYLRIDRSNAQLEDPVLKHPVDRVNYLVALKCEAANMDDHCSPNQTLYTDLHMERHQVASTKGVVPPDDLYHKAMQFKQCFPSCYKHLFPEGSCFLPDSTALWLISEKCHYRPKKLDVDRGLMSTFLLYAEAADSSLGFVADFLKEVQSIKFDIPDVRNRLLNIRHHAHLPFEPQSMNPTPFKLLQLLTQTVDSKLTALSFGLDESTLDTVTPVLTSYSGLLHLSISACGSISPDFEKLIAITKHQSALMNMLITITTYYERIGCSRGPIVTHTPKFSLQSLDSWIQACFEKATLHYLTITLHPITAKFLIQVLVNFLSTPCTHQQTLVFRNMTLGKQDIVENRGVRRDTHQEELLAEPPKPDLAEEDISELNLKQLGKKSTLRKKVLGFNSCNVTDEFISMLMKLPPLKLKKVIVISHHVVVSPHPKPSILTYLTQPLSFDMRTLKVTFVNIDSLTFEQYNTLLQKESLQTVHFDHCASVDSPVIYKAAAKQGFSIEKKVIENPRNLSRERKISYFLTKNK